MASKKIYQHHERTTVVAALADAQAREIVAGSGERDVVYTFNGGGTVRLTSHVFDITDYQASTSNADNTTQIQNAINAASYQVSVGLGTGGAIVVIPPGVFYTGAVTISSPFVSLRGHGRTASELRSVGSGTSLVKFDTGASAGNPTGMVNRIDHLKISYGSGTWTNLLHLKNLSWTVLSDLWLEGDNTNVTHCHYSESALSYTIQHSIFRYAKDYCVNIEKTNTGVTTGGHSYPNSVKFIDNEVERGGKFGVRFADGTMFKMGACQIEGNGLVSDVNHGGLLLDTADLEAGAGVVATISGTHFESNSGIHIKINRQGFAASRVLINGCNALGTSGPAGAPLYGVWGDVTSPNRGYAVIKDSNFFNALTYDIYFANDFVANLTNCQAMTQSLNQKCTAIPTPNNSSYSQTDLGLISYSPQEFNSGETTPTVSYRSPFKYFNNSGATTVTSLLGCGDGAFLWIYSPNTNTTLKHRASGSAGTADQIDCPGGVDYRLSAGESLGLFRINNHWYPMGFGGPFNGPATFNSSVSVAGNLNISDHIVFTAKTLNIRYDTSTATTNARICMGAGDADGGVVAKGAYIDLRGATNGVPGRARIAAANVTGGDIVLATGNDVAALTVNDDQTVSLSNDLKVATLGKGVKIKAGTNGRINLGNVLVAGTVTVANTSVTANTMITYNRVVSGGTLGHITITRNAGVGYTITSSSATETSTVDVMLTEAL